MVVLLASVCNLLPVGFVVGRLVSNPPLQLLTTLLVAFALTYCLVRILRRRFLDLVLTNELMLRPTSRNPRRRAPAAVQVLTDHGFSPVETVVVSTVSGTTLTQPIVVMARHRDGHVAHANSQGATLMTLLEDGTWLVTSTTAVIGHPTLRITLVSTGSVAETVDTHFDRLRSLHASGCGAADQPAPLDTMLHFERLEQETLAAFRAGGVVAPSAKALTGTPLR